ncbi:ABC transporter substrate-binding protein [Neorhizobium petrolearium]|uniref:ABC transporter substrate-binding protein n=1 Tax=Neorhizobium petrolearium TaxID=515361 RepID=UPI003F157656
MPSTRFQFRYAAAAIISAATAFLPAGSAMSMEKIAPETAKPELTAMLPDSIKSAGVINVATDAHYPPCQWFLEDGKTMVGYEVDIWDALAQVLGVKLNVVSIDFAGLIPGVASSRYDMAMECITDRVEREEQVTFVNHSLTYGNAFYYVAGTGGIKPGEPDTLCGLRTAGQSGTDFVTNLHNFSKWCTDKGLKALTIGEFPQQSAVLLALFANRIDFALSESSAVNELKANNPVDVQTIPNPLEKQNYLGIIVAKENTQLADALVAALKAIKASGTYDKIFAKWDLKHAALDEFGINMTTTKPLKQ